MPADTAITIAVKRQDSSRVGQVTLRSSPRVSRRYRVTGLTDWTLFLSTFLLDWVFLLFFVFFIFSSATTHHYLYLLKSRMSLWEDYCLPRGYNIQGVQELNPQPTVLETVALPIELTPYT